MSNLQKRVLLFLIGCIGLRLCLVYLAKTLDKKYVKVIIDKFFKLIAWYDNEYGYSSKLVDLSLHVASL